MQTTTACAYSPIYARCVYTILAPNDARSLNWPAHSLETEQILKRRGYNSQGTDPAHSCQQNTLCTCTAQLMAHCESKLLADHFICGAAVFNTPIHALVTILVSAHCALISTHLISRHMLHQMWNEEDYHLSVLSVLLKATPALSGALPTAHGCTQNVF